MKSPLRKQQEKLWKLCKQITLNKYGNTCYTCDRNNLEGSNCQLGHCIPSGACGAFLRYDLRNLRIQCYHCNINLGGNGAEYVRRLTQEVGKKEVDKMFKDKQKSVKATDHYAKLIQEYELIVEKL
jgi:hypothetical protein